MPVEHGSASNYAVEMRRHEAYHTPYGAPGRPYTFKEFPKAMYRFKREAGKGIVQDEYHVVKNDLEQRNLESRGFHETQEAAIAAIEREHTEHGKLAAEREYAIRHGHHSERAVAEVRAAEEAHGATHMPVMPETPIKKRTRGPNKPKAAKAATQA